MLSSDQVGTFQERGFLLGRQVLQEEEVEVLLEELDRVIRETGSPFVREQDFPSKKQPILLRNLSGNPETPIWQIVNIWEASELFRRLLYHPQIVSEVAQLTGAKELRVWHDQIQYKPVEKGGTLMWHQDSPYWPILTPKESQVTAWVALDEVDESNGCMSMVPGSHRWGVQVDFLHTLNGFDEMPSRFGECVVEVVRCPVPKGYVHYHHSLTWHASHGNISGRPRRAIAIHYMTEQTCYNASGEHVMKPFVTVPNGMKLTGDHFPLVWQNGPLVA